MRSLIVSIALLAACGGNKTAGNAPPAPAGLAASGGQASVALSWSASSGATGYVVQRSGNTGGPYATVASPGTPGFNDSGLAASTTYFYVVQAINQNGTSGNSNEASATTLPASAALPGVPAGVTATATGTTIAVTWTAVSGATGYVVSRATAAAGPYAQVAAPAGNAYSDGGLAEATTYYYKVRAVNAAGSSADSAEAHATTGVSGPVAPAAPVVSASGGAGAITLTWTAVAGVTYSVQRGAAAGSYTQLAASATSPYADNGLAAGATWHYQVIATNAAGSTPSADVAASTLPAAPTGVAAQPGNGAAQVSWQATAGATGYDVLSASSAGGTYAVVAANVSALTYAATGLTNGQLVCFEVQAIDAAGRGPASTAACTTPDGRPNPVVLSGTAGNASAALTWTASAGATSYQLYRVTRPGNTAVKIADQAGTSFNDTGAANDVAYDYYVIAHNAQGDSASSNLVTLTPRAPLAAPALTAVGLDGKIKLSWGAVARAGSYDVFRVTVKGAPYGAAIATVSGTSYLDTVPNYTDVPVQHTVYYYKVQAKSPGEPSGALSAEVSATAAREICVASDAPQIYALNADLDGEQDVRRTFGGQTRLAQPSAISVDAVNGEIYALNVYAFSVTVHKLSDRGDVPPTRLLAGAATGMTRATGLFVDAAHDELFVANQTAQHTGNILVFARLADGAAAPVRTLDVNVGPTGVWADANNLYVLAEDAVYTYARGASGQAQPVRSFTPSNGLAHLQSILVSGTEIFVGDNDQSAADSGNISVFRTSDSGTPAPQRSIARIAPVSGLALNPGTSELIVASDGASTINVWAKAASGSNPSPLRTVTLPGQMYTAAVAYDGANNQLWFSGSYVNLAMLGILAPAATGWVDGSAIGTAPGLHTPYPVGIASDPVTRELWFASFRGDFDFAGRYDGTAAVNTTVQTRQLDLPGATAVAINPANDEIYVTGSLSVAVYARTGSSTTPLRTLSGLSGSDQLAFNGGQLFINDTGNRQVLVYTRNGDGSFTQSPNSPITGAATGIEEPTGIFVDDAEIVVQNLSGSVVVLPRSWGSTTNPAFLRRIPTTGASQAQGVIKGADGNLYVSNTSTASGPFTISVYGPAANGAGAVPLRTIRGRGTGLAANGLAFCN